MTQLITSPRSEAEELSFRSIQALSNVFKFFYSPAIKRLKKERRVETII